MVHKSWTDNEILGIIQLNAPEHIAWKAWDALVCKYQDELEEYAFELWGGDDFLVSDTLDRALITARAWIKASDEIDAANGNVRDWLRSITRGQFYQYAGCAWTAAGNHNGSIGEEDDWMEDEFTSFEIGLSAVKSSGYDFESDEIEDSGPQYLLPRAQHLIEDM